MGGKKKYIEMFGSFTEPFNWSHFQSLIRIPKICSETKLTQLNYEKLHSQLNTNLFLFALHCVGNHVIINDQSYLLIYLVGWIISLNNVVWADIVYYLCVIMCVCHILTSCRRAAASATEVTTVWRYRNLIYYYYYYYYYMPPPLSSLCWRRRA